MKKWEDKTKGWDSNEVVSSDIRLGTFRLSIHRHIDHEPDAWLASCAHLFSKVALKSKDIDNAKCQMSSSGEIANYL